MLAACFLLWVAVAGCDDRADQYAQAAARVRPEHWSMVSVVTIYGRCGGQALGNRVWLPRHVNELALFHEVGHIVFREQGLYDEWQRQFWPNNQWRGSVPTSYARRNGPREDAAESYMTLMTGVLDVCCRERAAWLRQRLPEMADELRDPHAALRIAPCTPGR
jgi:hypothetical protein